MERAAVCEQYPLAELIAAFLKVCDAMEYAHAKGVIHRDLKPDNIMLGQFGQVLVLDWGLAKPVGRTVSGEPLDRSMIRSVREANPGEIATLEGIALGTPQFMCPEQASGASHSVDARADVYALGAILYNIVTLRPPIDGSDPEETFAKVVAGAITPAADAISGRAPIHLPGGRLPDALVKIAVRAMALRPEDRYPSVRALREQVGIFHAEEPAQPLSSRLLNVLGRRK
jgi:serine/threonine protein kinase